MKGFVATWFFPPSTSAEGLVTYKLLKNSNHQYDVCSSLSNQWSYKEHSALTAENIHSIFVDTEEIDIWVKESIEIFEKKHQENPYDFIMTRSMPPESIKVGLYIKKKYPDIKWIASFGDPISKNPYELQAYIGDNNRLNKHIKNRTLYHPQKILPLLKAIPDAGIRLLNQLMDLEKKAFEKADLLLFPSCDQCLYSIANNLKKYRGKCLVLPHSYDANLYPSITERKNDKLVFTYIGYADALRTPRWFLNALKLIHDFNPALLKKIHVNIIGNIPSEMEDLVYSYFLYDVVSILPSVNYAESLKIMQTSDWLLHVDAHFGFVPNGSIFFASKIADYIGAGKPIFALTGDDSTASKIVKRMGGVSIVPWDTMKIALTIVDIINGASYNVSIGERQKYNAVNVAKQFDSSLQDWQGNLDKLLEVEE